MAEFDISTDFDHLPVIGLAEEYQPSEVHSTHSHRRAQLLYASSGVMSVTVSSANYTIPPQRALWIPANVPHEVSCRGHVSLRTLYFNDELAARVEQESFIVEVSDFLKALILELVRLGTTNSYGKRSQLITELLLGELISMPPAPCTVPLPEDFRLRRVCQHILEDPSNKLTLDDLAAIAGMGRRTFSRLFKVQTGVGVAAWWRQVRLMEALSMLSSGERVTTVALAVGYESPSAFTSVFQKTFGMSPSEYRSSEVIQHTQQ
ncbi:helix-turn-helix domain-containing protein [Hyphococcus sp. DH-69]|uniref:AraC family transcriptional regulator n=1 Tax=Hyphococcus formosus TaxID=3143534 RepID=UPI00398B420A